MLLMFSDLCSSASLETNLYEEAFEDCMTRMIKDEDVHTKVIMDANLYKQKGGRFGLVVAAKTIDKAKPMIWWEMFGTSTHELKIYAMRIIGLCGAASSCERNWSTFEFIQQTVV